MRAKGKGGAQFNKAYGATTGASVSKEMAGSTDLVTNTETSLKENDGSKQPDDYSFLQNSTTPYGTSSPQERSNTTRSNSPNGEERLSLLDRSLQDRKTPSRARTCQSLPTMLRPSDSIANSLFSRRRRRLPHKNATGHSIGKCQGVRWGIYMMLIFGLFGLTAHFGGLGNSDAFLHLQILTGQASKITQSFSTSHEEPRSKINSQRRMVESEEADQKKTAFPVEKYTQYIRSGNQEKVRTKEKMTDRKSPRNQHYKRP
mmetsp:Transcript_28078/g.77220  ORF Transcript_28078/g.77220 Transcript_28078/m.77220 type:complete len:259 (+) Transcript_28078:434-1210(+)